jgi:hypothetical protein
MTPFALALPAIAGIAQARDFGKISVRRLTWVGAIGQSTFAFCPEMRFH